MKNCEVNRTASIKDLNNYFKIKDLLGGLTESQQIALRKNIGIKPWSGDVDLDVEIYHIGDTPPEDTDLLWISNIESTSEVVEDPDILQQITARLNELESLYSGINQLLSLGVQAGDSFIGSRIILSTATEPINPLPDSEEPEPEVIEPTKLTYTVPNISIKVDTGENFQKNLNNLIDGELCWVVDQKKLFIYYKGEFIYIGTASTSSGVTTDEIMKHFFDYLGFTSSNGNNFRLFVDNDGNIKTYYYKPQDVGTVDNTYKVYINPLLSINSIFCGGDNDEFSYQSCSHNFVELANASTVDVNLNNLYLLYAADAASSFKGIPLQGKIKAGSTFLIRGAQCSAKTNTTIINVDEYDLEWYDKGELIKFSQTNPIFYLVWSDNGKFYNPNSDTPVDIKDLTTVLYNTENIPKGYIDLVGIKTSEPLPDDPGTSAEGSSPVNITKGDSFSDLLFVRYFTLDPVSQANKAYGSRKSNSLWTYINLQKESEDRENPLYYYNNITKLKYTPRDSKSNKNIFTTKTVFSKDTPNMVNITFGIQATDNGNGATRCFNWVSVGYYDEYIEYGTSPEALNTKVESIHKGGSYDSSISDYINIYDRIRWITTSQVAVTTHKVIIKGLTAGTYYYRVGRYNDNSYKSEIYSFTVRSNVQEFSFIQTSDQQGFNWLEYQAWKKSAYHINKEHSDVHFTINTGDITQNGNRENEWLDYYNGRQFLRNKEEMFTIGNNDLCGVQEYLLGTGAAGTYKINHKNITLYYTFEIDPNNPPIFSNIDGDTEVYLPSLYSFNYGDFHFISINSEFAPNTYKVYKSKENNTGAFKKDIYKNMADWFIRDMTPNNVKRNGNKCIVYCHEMPFTILTNATLGSANPERGGSKLNDPCTEYGNYYFSRLFKYYGIRLVMGGHKHSFSITHPVYDAPAGYESNFNIDSLLSGTISAEASMKPIVQVLSTEGLSTDYARYEIVNSAKQITAPTYVMTQATGYKLVSNKDVPSSSDYKLGWLRDYFPGSTAAKPNVQQYRPMYVQYSVTPTSITVNPVQITNIYSEPANNKNGSFNINNQSSTAMGSKNAITNKLIIQWEQ